MSSRVRPIQQLLIRKHGGRKDSLNPLLIKVFFYFTHCKSKSLFDRLFVCLFVIIYFDRNVQKVVVVVVVVKLKE